MADGQSSPGAPVRADLRLVVADDHTATALLNSEPVDFATELAEVTERLELAVLRLRRSRGHAAWCDEFAGTARLYRCKLGMGSARPVESS